MTHDTRDDETETDAETEIQAILERDDRYRVTFEATPVDLVRSVYAHQRTAAELAQTSPAEHQAHVALATAYLDALPDDVRDTMERVGRETLADMDMADAEGLDPLGDDADLFTDGGGYAYYDADADRIRLRLYDADLNVQRARQVRDALDDAIGDALDAGFSANGDDIRTDGGRDAVPKLPTYTFPRVSVRDRDGTGHPIELAIPGRGETISQGLLISADDALRVAGELVQAANDVDDRARHSAVCPNCGTTGFDGQGRVRVQGTRMYLRACTDCSIRFAVEDERSRE